MFSPGGRGSEGRGRGGAERWDAGLPGELDIFENWDLIFNPLGIILCQKSTRRALKLSHTFL